MVAYSTARCPATPSVSEAPVTIVTVRRKDLTMSQGSAAGTTADPIRTTPEDGALGVVPSRAPANTRHMSATLGEDRARPLVLSARVQKPAAGNEPTADVTLVAQRRRADAAGDQDVRRVWQLLEVPQPLLETRLAGEGSGAQLLARLRPRTD